MSEKVCDFKVSEKLWIAPFATSQFLHAVTKTSKSQEIM